MTNAQNAPAVTNITGAIPQSTNGSTAPINATVTIPASVPDSTVITIDIEVENETTHVSKDTSKTYTAKQFRAGQVPAINSSVPAGTRGQAWGNTYAISYTDPTNPNATINASDGLQGNY